MTRCSCSYRCAGRSVTDISLLLDDNDARGPFCAATALCGETNAYRYWVP